MELESSLPCSQEPTNSKAFHNVVSHRFWRCGGTAHPCDPTGDRVVSAAEVVCSLFASLRFHHSVSKNAPWCRVWLCHAWSTSSCAAWMLISALSVRPAPRLKNLRKWTKQQLAVFGWAVLCSHLILLPNQPVLIAVTRPPLTKST
jgi:hypothetical protein